TGEKTSLAALTDSTTAASPPCFRVLPATGSSTKTTSPSCSWACCEMPTVATSPSILTHSWSLVNFMVLITIPLASTLHVAMGNKGQTHDLCGKWLVTNNDREGGFRCGVLNGDIAQCNRATNA